MSAGIVSTISVRHYQTTSGPMPEDSTYKMDDDSTDLEDGEQIELQHFIPTQHDVKILTRKEARTARLQFLALCCSFFSLGWLVGGTGPLLPSIQKYYDIGYESASWLFALGCAGGVVGALLNMPLIDRLGLGNMLVFGAFLQAAAVIVPILRLPFPFFALSSGIGAIGMSFQDASGNGFIATLQNDSKYKMGFLHASYGIGALTAPLSATHFAQSQWTHHYLVSLFLCVCNVIILARVFKFQTQDECLWQAGEIPPVKLKEIDQDKFIQLMKNKSAHLLALFVMFYVAVELTITGWIVTFMLIVRKGGPSSGYVSTGFYTGLTLGRVVLLEVTKKIGNTYAIYTYILLAFLFQLIVWLVPSFVIGAISVCIIGMLLGPIYPTAMEHTARVLPHHLVNGTIGWISACGAAGNAVLSLMTGAMASKWGIESVQPLVLGTMIIAFTLWSFVPKNPPGA